MTRASGGRIGGLLRPLFGGSRGKAPLSEARLEEMVERIGEPTLRNRRGDIRIAAEIPGLIPIERRPWVDCFSSHHKRIAVMALDCPISAMPRLDYRPSGAHPQRTRSAPRQSQ